MRALVNAFMRCLSFLLPPSWLCVSLCLWVGNECEETLSRPNPRARFKSRKLLTYEEVAAVAAAALLETQGGCCPSVSPGPGCVSLAATSSAAPQGPLSGRIWIGGLWRAVERVLGAPWVLLRHHWSTNKPRAGLRTPYPLCAFESSKIKTLQGGAAAAAAATTTQEEKGDCGSTLTYSRNMSGSSGIPNPSPAECASDASTEQGIDEVITVDQHTQEMGTVTITVAIQAAEDEDPEEVSHNNIDFLGGSCSEDEIGRHDKSRYGLSADLCKESYILYQQGFSLPWNTFTFHTCVTFVSLGSVEGEWNLFLVTSRLYVQPRQSISASTFCAVLARNFSWRNASSTWAAWVQLDWWVPLEECQLCRMMLFKHSYNMGRCITMTTKGSKHHNAGGEQ